MDRERRIERDGYVLYWVFGGPTPSWYYTVGLGAEGAVPELVVAGTTVLLRDDLQIALGDLADRVRSSGTRLETGGAVEAGALGTVGLRSVHPTWSAHLLLGAADHHRGRAFDALQLVPTVTFVDTPDLSQTYDADREPAWRWLTEPWPFSLPTEALAITDLGALHGDPVTVVNHHRDDAEAPWEFYSGTKTPAEAAMRLVPVGTLVAIDPTLSDALELEPGTWAERESETAPWEAYWMP
jgi:hypothetical protein